MKGKQNYFEEKFVNFFCLLSHYCCMLSISPKDESFISHFITAKKRDRVRRVGDRYREREREGGRAREEGGKERDQENMKNVLMEKTGKEWP
jgi:hypothetical protein